MSQAMNRIAVLLALCATCAVAACGSDDKVQILVFQAAPDAIEAGQSSQLVFAVEPADARLMISGQGDLTGKTEIQVTPAMTTSYQLTATKGSAVANRMVTVMVGATTAVAVQVAPATAMPTAGDALPVTLTVLGVDGKTARGFRGTLRLTSTDAQAVLPGDLAFTAADAGVKQAMVTLKTAGTSTLIATDATGKAAASGSTTLTVQPGPAHAYQLGALPASAVAGQPLVLTITVLDGFGNVATHYTGQVQLTSTDVTDVLPPAGTFVAGVRSVSLAFLRAGSHLAQVQDVAAALPAATTNSVAVGPAAASRLVLAVPASANAGYPVSVGLAVRDVFDNAIPTYAGTVTFTSTDQGTGAVTPAPITFTGSEGGVQSTSITFFTPGSQTLSAAGTGSPQPAGAVTAAVHGLVYTGPGAGRVRLVANPAQSTAQVVQLDLVANERLEVSSFFAGGPGPFGAGMNLPLDTTRVTGDTTLFVPGAALPLGTGVAAALGRIGSDHVLYTVVSTKRLDGDNFSQSTDVQAGQVFYSVRLRVTPTGTPGTVFDGADPSPLYRAAVRDQYGDDVVSQGDIGVGRLEIR
ncbi:MAG TPA: hypothetical protein VHW23_47940 [Kofleriaceae bacterium]|jgi:hypothetical protein|nr:hypothetical protein [Kofleriaceae bacterium]